MTMFPDDFPFNRRDDEPAATGEPVVEAQPLSSDAFPEDFPIIQKSELQAPVTEPRAALTPSSSLFAPGFPFTEPQPEAAPRPEPAAAMTQATAEAIAPSPAAPMPAPMPAPAPAPLPFKDRRRSPRQRMNAKASLRVDTVAGNPLHVEIDNLSLLGVRFRTTRELLINDKANIRLEVGPLKWNARLRVINCMALDAESYLIGCEFVGNELARGRIAA
jgi:hypothetical protein